MQDARRSIFRNSCTWIGLALLASAGTLQAQVEPVKAPDVAAKAFESKALTIEEHYESHERSQYEQ